MRQRSEEYVAAVREAGVRNVHADLGRLALTIVGDTILGLRLDPHADAIREAMEMSTAQFRRRMWRARPQARGEPSALIPLVDTLVADRRREAVPGPDVLWALLEAVDEQGRRLDDEEIRDQVITLMLAGHETTAGAMAFTLGYLGTRPDLVARLREEQDAAGDAALDPRGLPVMRAVISETLRLRPSAWIFGRRLLRDIAFGDVVIDEDTLAAVSPWVLHHSARWFDDPETFDADRWLDDRSTDVPRYAYLPFGAGPRGCIGEQFAMIEAGVALGTIVDGLDVAGAGHEPSLEFAVTLRPRGGVTLRVSPRR
jgi:cytochrome P450